MSHEEFDGKVVFVAGGTSGINLQIAKRFAELGARIALLGRDPDRAKAASESLDLSANRTKWFSADVRDYAAVEKSIGEAVSFFDAPVDILISGAAGNFVAPAEKLSTNGFKAVIDIDLVGTFNVFRAGYEYLRKPGASLIAISATHGTRPFANQAHVCAAKAGVNMLTRCLAIEWGNKGIRVNGISPGPIADTEGMRRLAPTEEIEKKAASSVPLGRFGTKDEVADLALFLCGQASKYITGSIIECDGGSQNVR